MSIIFKVLSSLNDSMILRWPHPPALLPLTHLARRGMPWHKVGDLGSYHVPLHGLLCPTGHGFGDTWGAGDGGAGQPRGFMLKHWQQLGYPCTRCHLWHQRQGDAMGVESILLRDGPVSMLLRQPMVCWVQAQLDLHLPAQDLHLLCWCLGQRQSWSPSRVRVLPGPHSPIPLEMD